MKREQGIKIAQNLVSWFQKQGASLPWREIYSREPDPYFVWVSEIMLQQTQISAVIPKYITFIEKFPSIYHLAYGPENQVRKQCQGLGYYRRFAQMHRCAKEIVGCSATSENKSKPVKTTPLKSRVALWPQTKTDLMQLPGIGDYTAGAISSIAFNQPVAAVDGNVERVFSRVWGFDEFLGSRELKVKCRQKQEFLLEESEPRILNQAIMELGQKICIKGTPRCDGCPIRLNCLSFQKGETHKRPKKKAAKPMVSTPLFIQIPSRGKKLDLRNFKGTKFLKGISGFPIFLKNKQGSFINGQGKVLNLSDMIRLGQYNHAITKHKISATVVCHKDIKTQEKCKIIQKIKDFDDSIIASIDKKALEVFKSWIERTAFE